MPHKMKSWEKLAHTELSKIFRKAGNLPALNKLCPRSKPWIVEFRAVGGVMIGKLNSKYRHKNTLTDILSFPAPRIFYKQGVLGELVVCIPVLKKQALRFGHSPSQELRILLVHGFLHLLGFDHEKNVKNAKRMEFWEKKLLKSQAPGLIERSE